MKQKKSRNFKNYKVWQDAVSFATLIYKVCNSFPSYERFGLCNQLQRAVVSISSNIAEGSAKPTDDDFARFLDVALGSSFEVETQLFIAKNINYITEEQFYTLQQANNEIQKQLVGLIGSIRQA
ncbi:MAG: four helix bundle protein [Bacteroidales bacterium]|nr:four helix bundle protein [Candidatus Sodaliphilus fimicaballi]